MPYSQDSEVPTYVPQDKRAQWREVWNSAHSAALKDNLSAEEAEARAFREANGVAGPNAEKIAISFIPFSKNTSVDAKRRRIRGIAAAEVPDRQGEIMDYEASKPHIQAWSDEIYKTSGGKSYGNVRAMHPRGYIAVGKIAEPITFNDAAKQIEVEVEIWDDVEWEKIEQGLYTGFSFGGKYARKWLDVVKNLTRYAALPFELTLADYPCIPGANFSLAKIDGSVIEVPLIGAVKPIDRIELDGQQYELRWIKSSTREEQMTPEEKTAMEKLQTDMAKLAGDIGDLRKVSEAHKAHLEGMATHHAGMGHHLNSMIEDCNKIAKGEKIDFSKTATVSAGAVDANGFVSIGKTADGVEIFKKAPVDQNAVKLTELSNQISEMNKNFGEFVIALGEGLQKQRELPGKARPFIATSSTVATMAKTADGNIDATKTATKVDDGKPITSGREAAEKPDLLKSVFAKPVGSNEIEMAASR